MQQGIFKIEQNEKKKKTDKTRRDKTREKDKTVGF